MTCEECRHAVSARLDGEASRQDLAAAEHHLAGCGTCRDWVREAEILGRRLRVRTAGQVPDLSAAVVAAAGDLRQHRRAMRRRTALRLGLVAVAGAQLALALPELSGHVHAGNEAASWTVAAAVGLVAAAASPRRVSGLLPMLAAAAFVLVLITVRDIADGHVHVEHELSHALLIVGVVLLWLLGHRATDVPRRGNDVVSPRSARPWTARRAA